MSPHFPVEVTVWVGGFSDGWPAEDLVVDGVEIQERCGCTDDWVNDYGKGEHHAQVCASEL